MLLAVNLAIVGGGLAAARTLRSPADAAAQTEPPDRTVLTERVVRRSLHEVVNAHGTATAARVEEISAVAPQDGRLPVITRMPAQPGQRIAEGELVAEIAGRPLRVHVGAVPTYRDLRPGIRGDDVTQLQSAFARLGLPTAPDIQGTYGQGTARAVGGWYRRAGYDPPGPPPDETSAIEAANASERAAARALDEARHNLSTARDPEAMAAGRSQVVQAATNLAEARQQQAARQSLAGARIPASELRFVPELPGTVSGVKGAAGMALDRVDGPLLTLASGPTVVAGLVGADEGQLIAVGAEATLQWAGGPGPIPGQLTALADTLTTIDGETGLAFRVLPPGGTVPPSGTQVSVVIHGRATRSDVLAVPLTAIHERADGTTTLARAVRGPDGQLTSEQVPVTLGLSADGWVEVTGVAEADEVVVGQ